MSSIVLQDISVTITIDQHSLLNKLKSNFLYNLGESHESTAHSTTHIKLLNNINGILCSNKLICILGGSGAGKSTLLNVMTNRLTASHNTNTLQVSGSIYTYNQLTQQKQCYNKHNISYVPQQSILLAQLTVYETLYYYTKLQLYTWSDEQHELHIDTIINQLQLNKCRHTRVGDEYTQGISGGERKRLNIAIELIKQNNLLILDEPSTGLDSNTSYKLIKLLKSSVTQHNITVICSMHQPTSAILEQFDELMLLSKGNMVYCGRLDNVVPYFNQLGYQYNSTHDNLADWLLDITSVNYKTNDVDMIRIDMLTAAYQQYYKQQQLQSLQYKHDLIQQSTTSMINIITTHTQHNNTMNMIQRNTDQQLSIRSSIYLWCLQFYYLLLRSYTCITRMPLLRAAQLCTTVVMGLFIGLVYLHIGTDQTAIQNWLGSIYFILICIIMSAGVSHQLFVQLI